MDMLKEKNGNALTVKPVGRIDVTNAAVFEHDVNEELDGIVSFTLDLADVTYISSIGLRVILEFQKRMEKQGNMEVVNVREEIMEIFKIIGFDKVLNIV